MNLKSNLLSSKAKLSGASALIIAVVTLLKKSTKAKEDEELPDNPEVDFDISKFTAIREDIKRQFQPSNYLHYRFPSIGGDPGPAEPAPDPVPEEPKLGKIKVRIIPGSTQRTNMVQWNEKEGVLDLFYMNGFEPRIKGQVGEIKDGICSVMLEERVINYLKSRSSPLPLHSMGPTAKPFQGVHSEAYNKHRIGIHSCKHFIAPVSEEAYMDTKKLLDQGLLPERYEYGNVPFSMPMCTHPKRLKEQGNPPVTNCNSFAMLPSCNVYEAEEGVRVSIKTKTRGSFEGVKVRTHNPMTQEVQVEIFDLFGDRFGADIEHDILPEEEESNGDKIQDTRSPLSVR